MVRVSLVQVRLFSAFILAFAFACGCDRDDKVVIYTTPKEASRTVLKHPIQIPRRPSTRQSSHQSRPRFSGPSRRDGRSCPATGRCATPALRWLRIIPIFSFRSFHWAPTRRSFCRISIAGRARSVCPPARSPNCRRREAGDGRRCEHRHRRSGRPGKRESAAADVGGDHRQAGQNLVFQTLRPGGSGRIADGKFRRVHQIDPLRQQAPSSPASVAAGGIGPLAAQPGTSRPAGSRSRTSPCASPASKPATPS